MEGVVNSLIAQALLAKREIDLPLTESIVRSIIKIKNEQQGFTIEGIQQITAEYFNIPIEAMIGSSQREIVQSRQLAMYLIKKYMEIPLKSIGSAFGNRDHSTVIHACQVVADLSQTNAQFKKYVTELEKHIDKEGKKS